MTDPDEPSGPTIIPDACVLLDIPFTPDIAVWREVAGRGTLARLDQHPVAVDGREALSAEEL